MPQLSQQGDVALYKQVEEQILCDSLQVYASGDMARRRRSAWNKMC